MFFVPRICIRWVRQENVLRVVTHDKVLHISVGCTVIRQRTRFSRFVPVLGMYRALDTHRHDGRRFPTYERQRACDKNACFAAEGDGKNNASITFNVRPTGEPPFLEI